MSRLAGCLVLAFGLKLLGIVALTRILSRRLNGVLDSSVGAWLLIEIGIVSLMLFLSALHLLTALPLWIGIGLLSGSLVAYDCTESAKTGLSSAAPYAPFHKSEKLALLALGAICLVLFYRSLYFFDVTWDGLTYGLPRISLWSQFHSVFGRRPTLQLNLFVNEWNGEFNAAYYSILAQDDQATTFGNVEIWAVSALAYTWLANVFGLRRPLNSIVGLTMAATPALLGLSATVKGDLLACVSLALSTGWILLLTSSESPHLCFLLAAASLGLSAGAKIIILPAVPLLALVAIQSLRERARSRQFVFSILSAGAMLSVGMSRYLTNLVQYGHLLIRVGGEDARPSLVNVSANVKGIVSNIGSIVTRGVPAPPIGVLDLGMGAAGMLALACIVFLLLRTSWIWPRARALPASLVASFLVVVISVPWQPWSFRYFVPWIYVGATLAIAKAFVSVPKRAFVPISIGAVIMASFHLVSILHPGEALPGASASLAFAAARGQSQVQRKLALHPYLFSDVGQLGKAAVDRGRKSILILNRSDSALEPFFGQNESNEVMLVDSPDTLKESASHGHYTWVVVSGPRFPAENESIWKVLQASGYFLTVDCEFWRIAALSVNVK